MSEALTPGYTIAANLRWFAVIYTIATVVVAAAVELAYRNGVELPTTGLNIGVYAGVTLAAAQRFAARRAREWDGRIRNNLALGYTLASTAVSVVLFGALLAFDEITRRSVVDMFSQSSAIMIGALVVGVVIFYGMARLMLGVAQKVGDQKA